MTAQLPLFRDKLEDEFLRFHEANPQVYALVCRFADEAIRAGRGHYGIASIFERIRWHVYVETRSEDGFKLNNDFRAFYARLWLDEHPEHPDFFETRTRRVVLS